VRFLAALAQPVNLFFSAFSSAARRCRVTEEGAGFTPFTWDRQGEIGDPKIPSLHEPLRREWSFRRAGPRAALPPGRFS
jgi:hypothetical protein